ncbi:MAG: 30S ribosomal protein S18 [Candidatus Omnitrophota bacterium]|jgi:small subunit ribosomal protein S18|nr:MAG: 30S ribosomal protein S18 [Candidatus Omnitrophota bacterium]
MRFKSGKFEKRTTNKKSFEAGVSFRKKVCRLCADKVKGIDYKDLRRLESFVRERGKIISRRISGNCAKHQRMLAEAVKKARFIGLLPYVKN